MVSTPLKNISQHGNLPQVGVKIKHLWNHHPENQCQQKINLEILPIIIIIMIIIVIIIVIIIIVVVIIIIISNCFKQKIIKAWPSPCYRLWWPLHHVFVLQIEWLLPRFCAQLRSGGTKKTRWKEWFLHELMEKNKDYMHIKYREREVDCIYKYWYANLALFIAICI